MERLVVVGASLAGLRAVQSARRAGFTGSITLIGAEEHVPYDRPPLSKAFLAAGHDGEAASFHSADELREQFGVELRLGVSAEALDTAAREVHLPGRAVPYDGLVIATGATPRTLPGADGIAGVHQLRTLDDAVAIRNALDAGARTVVVGAGFIGSEVASAARKRNLPVTVVDELTAARGRELGDLLRAHELRIDVAHAAVCARQRDWPLVTAEPTAYGDIASTLALEPLP